MIWVMKMILLRLLLCPVKTQMHITMKRTITLMALAALLGACGQDSPDHASNAGQVTTAGAGPVTPSGAGQEAVTDEASDPNILQVALGSKDHTTLVAAVKACNQTTALANNGPLTVFAPTNAAFEALPAGTVEELLKPENVMKLTSIVQFHAAPGTYDVPALKDGMSLFVASGNNIKVEVRDDGTYVHGAKILGTVKAANGIVHVVDKVLLPNN